ncbi:MAG: class I SAM-dependent methyltransferase [Flavobacteriales bacterium]|nr:class I SAM-dependent methyltransferase [Flavobacteriales bacterium]
MESVPACPICGEGSALPALVVKDHHLTQEEFELVDCRGCGMRRTNPRPTATAMGGYYASEEYLSHDASSGSLLARIYRMARSLALARKHRLIRAHVTGGRLLDLGCGTGDQLAHLSARGYQVEGVEPGVRARETAIRQHALKVVPQLGDVPAEEQFQVITLWHVMEHLHELPHTVKRLNPMLAPGGLLFAAVPDRESWDCAHYGPFWAAWDVPRHIWHFRRQDMQRLLSANGFKLMKAGRMPLDAYFIALLSERYKGRPSPVCWILAVLVGTWSNLLATVGVRPSSSTLFIARKA